MKKVIVLNPLGRKYLNASQNLTPEVKPLVIALLEKEDKQLVEILDKSVEKKIGYLTSRQKYVLSESKTLDYFKALVFNKLEEVCENPKFMVSLVNNDIFIIKRIGFSRQQISDFLNTEIDMDFLKKFTENNIVGKINGFNKNKKIKVDDKVQKSDTVRIYYVNVSYKLSLSIENLVENYNIVTDDLTIDSKVVKELQKATTELNQLEKSINELYIPK